MDLIATFSINNNERDGLLRFAILYLCWGPWLRQIKLDSYKNTLAFWVWGSMVKKVEWLQAVIRCIMAYLTQCPIEELPYINVPLHTVIKVHKLQLFRQWLFFQNKLVFVSGNRSVSTDIYCGKIKARAYPSDFRNVILSRRY